MEDMQQELELLDRLLYQHRSQHCASLYFQRIKGASRWLKKFLIDSSNKTFIEKADTLLIQSASGFSALFTRGFFTHQSLVYLAIIGKLHRTCKTLLSNWNISSPKKLERGQVVDRKSFTARKGISSNPQLRPASSEPKVQPKEAARVAPPAVQKSKHDIIKEKSLDDIPKKTIETVQTIPKPTPSLIQDKKRKHLKSDSDKKNPPDDSVKISKDKKKKKKKHTSEIDDIFAGF